MTQVRNNKLFLFFISALFAVGTAVAGVTAKPKMAERSPFRESVKVYPNPASEILHLEVDEIENGHGLVIEILNLTGKVIYSERPLVSGDVWKGNILLDHRFSSGIYLLKITSGENSSVQRIVVAK